MSHLLNLDLRKTAVALAIFLGLYSLWTLIPEYIRPGLNNGKFPVVVSQDSRNSYRLSSDLAAWIGFVRGDLWAEKILVDSGNILNNQDAPTRSLPSQDIESVRVAAERALAMRPLDPRTWLVLASLPPPQTKDGRISDQLKMAYYTGPNDVAEMSYRLKSALAAQNLDDADLRESVRREIRTILRRLPAQRAAITAAYAKASPKGREFIESTVAETDPTFVPTLKAAGQ